MISFDSAAVGLTRPLTLTMKVTASRTIPGATRLGYLAKSSVPRRRKWAAKRCLSAERLAGRQPAASEAKPAHSQRLIAAEGEGGWDNLINEAVDFL
jgi:hypothetical protein